MFTETLHNDTQLTFIGLPLPLVDRLKLWIQHLLLVTSRHMCFLSLIDKFSVLIELGGCCSEGKQTVVYRTLPSVSLNLHF